MAAGTLSFSIENEIVYTDTTSRVLGTLGDGVGWYWDRRILSDTDIPGTTWTTGFGVVTTGLLEGTSLEDWYSGVIQGLELNELMSWVINDLNVWTPVYGVGQYSIHWDRRRLYSDYSISVVPDSDDLTGDGLQYLELIEGFRLNTVSARIYARDTNGLRMPIRAFEFVDNFTGALSGGARLDVGDVGSWVVGNFSDRHWEITLDELDRLVWNRDPGIWVGAETLTDDPDVIRNTWELIAEPDSLGRPLYLHYFPVDFDTVEVVAVDDLDVVTPYTRVAHLYASTDADYDFAVDRDQGIIDVGGVAAGLLLCHFTSLTNTPSARR